MLNQIFRQAKQMVNALNDTEHGARVLEALSRRGFAAVVAFATLAGMTRTGPTRLFGDRRVAGCDDCNEGDCGSGCEPDVGECPDLPVGDPPGAHCWCAKAKEEDWKLICDCVCGGRKCVCEEESSDSCVAD